MRIGFDLNGVIIDSTRVKLQLAREFYGLDLDPAHSIRDTLGHGIPEATYNSLQILTYWTSALLEAPALPEAVRSLQNLELDEHEVFTVTRLAPEGVQFGRQWLAEHRLSRERLISVGRGGRKDWVLSANFDIYIDDHGTILRSLKGIVPFRILFDAPYNQEVNDEGIIRVTNWQELLSKIKELKTQKPEWQRKEFVNKEVL